MPAADSENLTKDFSLYPLLRLAFCFSVGILAANVFVFDWKLSFTASLVFAVLAAVFIRQKSALIFISLAFVAVGALHFQIKVQTVVENRVKRIYDENRATSGDPIEIEGVLQGKPELAVGGFFLLIDADRAVYKDSETAISGIVRLFAQASDEQTKGEYEQLELNYGSRLRVACNLRREDNFQNPGAISQKEVLDQKDIDATAIVKSPLLIEKIGARKTFAPLAWVYERRQNLIVEFRDKFSASTAGVLIASLLGDKYFLDKPTAQVFREGGTFHVLVISGLHITFIGGLTLLFVQLFTDKRLWQFLIATGFLWAYSLAVGADVPVVRAAIMFTILLFSQVIYRSGTLLNSLGACALILLVWRPADFFTQSFQLTFLSVGALVATAFPLVEKLRAIGAWSPSADAPFPPNVSPALRRFCETLYWNEAVWKRELSQSLWSANIFKAPYLKWLEKKNLRNPARYIFESILVSLIVQVWLLPLMVIYFHRFSPLAVLLNLWVGIVIALESFAAVFAVLVAQFSDVLAFPFVKITEIFNWLLVSVPQIFTDNDWASVRLPNYSGAMKAVYFLYFVPVIAATLLLNFWKPFAADSRFQISNFKFSAEPVLRFCAAVFLFFFALIVFHPFSAPAPDGKLHVDFLDVGQGDSALITFAGGETMLVDGGGRPNFNRISVKNEYGEEAEIFEPDTSTIGEAVVSQYLWEKGYSKIDYILATHADADHIQGLLDVAKNFGVQTALFGRTPIKDADFAELFNILQKRGIRLTTLGRGDVLNLGDAKVEVLFPFRDENADAVSDNNHSVVVRVICGSKKILLTGDIEKETETELAGAPEFVRADVVKVAHHGSRGSSTTDFINAAQAEFAIISVGGNSRFGHPHREVVERWRNTGAKVLTTGENGTITVTTDGKDLQIETFIQPPIFR